MLIEDCIIEIVVGFVFFFFIIRTYIHVRIWNKISRLSFFRRFKEYEFLVCFSYFCSSVHLVPGISSIGAGDRPPDTPDNTHTHHRPPCFIVLPLQISNRPVHEIRPNPWLSYLLYERTLVNQVDIYHHEIVISNWLLFCRDYLYKISIHNIYFNNFQLLQCLYHSFPLTLLENIYKRTSYYFIIIIMIIMKRYDH